MENEQEKIGVEDVMIMEQQSVPPREKTKNNEDDPTRFGDWEKKGRCIDF